jgi:flavin-dependent dehydrogenase
MTYDFTPMALGLRGYLWVFPLAGGGANVGLMHYPSTPRVGTELRRLLRDGLARYGIALPPRGARGWPAWGFDRRTPVAAPRLLAVGDAAGIDGLTGEGISVALEQGAIAADAVAQALASGDFGLAGYARALRRSAVGRELLLDRWLAARVYQRGERWRQWLAMMLFDRDFLDLYAARVAGTKVLADSKLRLAHLIGRHWLAQRRWRDELRRALAGIAAGERAFG